MRSRALGFGCAELTIRFVVCGTYNGIPLSGVLQSESFVWSFAMKFSCVDLCNNVLMVVIRTMNSFVWSFAMEFLCVELCNNNTSVWNFTIGRLCVEPRR